jgi:hypothetical protein
MNEAVTRAEHIAPSLKEKADELSHFIQRQRGFKL